MLRQKEENTKGYYPVCLGVLIKCQALANPFALLCCHHSKLMRLALPLFLEKKEENALDAEKLNSLLQVPQLWKSRPKIQAQVYAFQSVLALITNYLTRDGFPNKRLFLTILQCDKSRIKLPADVVPGEDSLPDLQMATFLYLHMAEREKQAVPFLFFLGH